MEQDSTTAEAAQPHPVPQQSPSLAESNNEPAADSVEQDFADGDYIEGRFDAGEKRQRFDEASCTVEEKELSDLFKRGLLEDGSTGPLKGDFTLHDLPQLIGDEACSVQWKTSKRKSGEKTSGGSRKSGQEAKGLTDDELASVLQACPDLEGFITKS